MIDGQIQVLLAGVGVVLLVATGIGRAVARQARTAREERSARDLQARIAGWWGLLPVMVACLWLERPGILGFFAVVSFLALRELLSLIPSRRADHGTLVLAFFLAVPVQYGLIWTGWYGLFAVFVPVWLLFVVSARLALAGDPERYLQRVAAIQYVLLVGVYAISHAPALLMLQIPGYEGQEHKLLVFLVAITQASDVLQFLWGRAVGRTRPWTRISPSKTLEGLVGGLLSVTLLGALLAPLLPFPWVEACGFALSIGFTGWLGGLVMSAIKRDAGVKDYGSLIPGHGGVLDRVDSLVFSAPLFFHLVRWLHASA